jgi:hypothetical protein
MILSFFVGECNIHLYKSSTVLSNESIWMYLWSSAKKKRNNTWLPKFLRLKPLSNICVPQDAWQGCGIYLEKKNVKLLLFWDYSLHLHFLESRLRSLATWLHTLKRTQRRGRVGRKIQQLIVRDLTWKPFLFTKNYYVTMSSSNSDYYTTFICKQESSLPTLWCMRRHCSGLPIHRSIYLQNERANSWNSGRML